MNDTRFELVNHNIGIIGRYPTKTDALRVAASGDSLFDRMARCGEVELWLVVRSDMGSKVLRAIRRKEDLNNKGER